jgi:hypothetical protein
VVSSNTRAAFRPPPASSKPEVPVRHVLLTFAALFLVVALLLGVAVWASSASFPWYAGGLVLLAIPVIVVLCLALAVRLYLRAARFLKPGSAPSSTPERSGPASPDEPLVTRP